MPSSPAGVTPERRRSMSTKENGSSEVCDIPALVLDGGEAAGTILDKAGDAGLREGFDSIAPAVAGRDGQGNVHVHEPGRGRPGAAGICGFTGVGYAPG
jgi:hypothetical protein